MTFSIVKYINKYQPILISVIIDILQELGPGYIPLIASLFIRPSTY